MEGPHKLGTYSDLPGVKTRQKENPIPGQKYRVIRRFIDADRGDHPEGEEWQYLGYMFNKFQNDVVYVIGSSSNEEWTIALNCDSDQQYDVVLNWQRYLTPI